MSLYAREPRNSIAHSRRNRYHGKTTTKTQGDTHFPLKPLLTKIGSSNEDPNMLLSQATRFMNKIFENDEKGDEI